MTIEKGQPWGGSAEVPSELVVVADDAELHRVLQDARAAGSVPPIGLTGGDLARTMGAHASASDLVPGAERVRLPVDLLEIRSEAGEWWAGAHAVARRHLLWGRLVFVMNSAFLGSWNVAPRAHPNDGRADVVDVGLGLADRLAARSRLASGTHVPHPDITVRRVATTTIDLDRFVDLRVDGVKVGRVRHLGVTVVPDALDIFI